MDLLNENCPDSCSKIGLDCGTCIHQSAASVATVCHGLDARGVQQLFVQLYSSPACHHMAPAFEQAYRESLDQQSPFVFASAAA